MPNNKVLPDPAIETKKEREERVKGGIRTKLKGIGLTDDEVSEIFK